MDSAKVLQSSSVMRICSFFAICLILMLSPTAAQPLKSFPTANISTKWTTNYSVAQPMLLREVDGTRFSCGFFCERNYTRYFFAIFISPANDPGQYKAVWSANRGDSVTANATLDFTAAGELVLKDVTGSIVWTTNTAGKSVAGMNLTDTGNLVLFDDHNSVVWQSFDYPTDSLLPGQKLFQDRYLISSESATDLSEGNYSLQITDNGVLGFVQSESSDPPQAYYGWLVYGNSTLVGGRYIMFSNGSLSFFIESSETSDPVGVIGIPQASSTQYMKLMPDGHLKLFEWHDKQITEIYDFTTVLLISYPTANLSTTWTTNYSVAQPMLRRVVNGALFGCGFFCEGDCTSYIFTIFISSASDLEKYKVVWSANRDHPVRDNATLDFTAAGELVLRDEDGSIVWTTGTAGKSASGMNLTDTGNLVLFDVNNSVVWQSFDHPTDCLLPGQKLFTGQKLKSSISSTNLSEGMYSLQVRERGLFVYVESNPPQAYYSWLAYGDDRHKGKRYVRLLNGSLSLFIHSSEPSDPDRVIPIPQASSAQYMKLLPDGHLQVFGLISFSGGWTVVADLLKDGYQGECDYPLVCGQNSICSTYNQECSCPNFEYYRPVNDTQPNLGCYEITPLTCKSTQDQVFITLKNVMYFAFARDMWVNVETCKQACLSNCSCKAAFFQYYSNASSGYCFLSSEILTMKTVDHRYFQALAFIKVQNATSHRLSHQVARVVGSTIGSFVLFLVTAIGCITYIVHKRKRGAEMEEGYLSQVPGMPTRFTYEELKIATENFNKKLGEGGFGSVFEGSMKDASKIAVKRLEGLSHIKKSFLAEVQSIGSIHHVNLVRLRGYCTWKSQHFLVYDFMSNGSLDKWIYHGNRKHTLDWKCRKKIILDIAKGLAYLHEECRQKIIHLDIKPQNILLDNNFNAKVSDFGLSKLMDRNQTQVMTTMRGTPGYLAPEWLRAVITEKVDVYSYGIVLLEILCGRQNCDRSQPEENWHLLSVFQKCWEQETLLDIVDMNSKDMQINGTEVVEMMKIASWCLQTDYTKRPSMSSVVKVLEGGMNVESNLNYDFTVPRLQEDNRQKNDLTPLLPSVLSGPRVGVISETLGDGVDQEVVSSVRGAISHLEELGCTVTEVSLPSFSLGLPAYYVLASSESSSNLSRYDGVRYGNQIVSDELSSLYGGTRANGFGQEVKRRILMGTYALSAGYYDAYYKRAQQVRTVVQKSFKTALDSHDILVSPAAPSAAYKIGEKKNDPLAMYAGDIMTVNVNLAGLPALVLPCGFVKDSTASLPVGFQLIGAAFDEEKLLRVGHIFEQTLQGYSFIPPLIADEFKS